MHEERTTEDSSDPTVTPKNMLSVPTVMSKKVRSLPTTQVTHH
jgi:hypothetical protein